MKDPALMTAEEIERIKVFSSAVNRKNGGGTPMFFFDFLYAAKSQVIIEDHIVRTTFLGHKTKVHERILGPLKKVESDIYKEAEKDSEIKTFIQSLKSTDAADDRSGKKDKPYDYKGSCGRYKTGSKFQSGRVSDNCKVRIEREAAGCIAYDKSWVKCGYL